MGDEYRIELFHILPEHLLAEIGSCIEKQRNIISLKK
jgi:hypothetical protein